MCQDGLNPGQQRSVNAGKRVTTAPDQRLTSLFEDHYDEVRRVLRQTRWVGGGRRRGSRRLLHGVEAF